VATEGNFEGGASVLNIASTLENISKLYGTPVEDLGKLLEEGREKLYAEREKRVRPGGMRRF